MADENSKKYLSGDGLRYALQQLKVKTDELYVSEKEIFETVSNEVSISGAELQGQYSIFDGVLNLVPGEFYTLVYDGQEYTDDCSATGSLKYQPTSKAWNITIYDKHTLEDLGGGDYDIVPTDNDTFVVYSTAPVADMVLKCGEKTVIKDGLLPDNIATKKYVDDSLNNMITKEEIDTMLADIYGIKKSYTVTVTGNNYTTVYMDNEISTILEGETYENRFYVTSDSINSATVTMGGEVLDDVDTYDGAKICYITIPNVTGDIVIDISTGPM